MTTSTRIYRVNTETGSRLVRASNRAGRSPMARDTPQGRCRQRDDLVTLTAQQFKSKPPAPSRPAFGESHDELSVRELISALTNKAPARDPRQPLRFYCVPLLFSRRACWRTHCIRGRRCPAVCRASPVELEDEGEGVALNGWRNTALRKDARSIPRLT